MTSGEAAGSQASDNTPQRKKTKKEEKILRCQAQHFLREQEQENDNRRDTVRLKKHSQHEPPHTTIVPDKVQSLHDLSSDKRVSRFGRFLHPQEQEQR